ncbi:pyridoxamine 5'-phosphate oxidase family protein [Cytobacillus suaedae]|nr:pyridoxamine 5'-phosphate oxidase family protein [Cytobacillus suaedae]
MANQVELQLIQSLFDIFQRERFVTLSTVDYETGGPNVNAISWVFAPDKKRIYVAIDNRSRIVENILKNSLVVLNVTAIESNFSISGKASIKAEKMEGVPLKLALIEILINEVRDVMFYGSKISVEPEYEKTYDVTAAEKLDKQVMDAMKRYAV